MPRRSLGPACRPPSRHARKAFVAQQLRLDSALASLPACAASADFDARFFRRLDAHKSVRRVSRWAWLTLPLAAAAALVLVLRTPAPLAPRVAPGVAGPDLGLAREIELVQALDVVSRLDEIESYDVLSQLDDADLREVTGGAL